MTNWQGEFQNIHNKRLFLIEKSFSPELISMEE